MVAAVSSSRASVRPGEDDPTAPAGELQRGVVSEAAHGRAGDQDRPAGLVGDVRQRPGVDAIGHGVVASDATTRSPRPWSPSTATEPGSASQRPPASRMKLSRSIRRVTVGSAGGSGSRCAAAGVVDRERVRRAALHVQDQRGAGRRADLLAEDEPEALREVLGGVPRRRGVHAARSADRAADVLLVHPDVERPVAEQVRQFHGTPPKIGDGMRVGVGRRVLSRAVCRFVAATGSR